VMRFDKKTHKVKVETLSLIEAEEFKNFLLQEQRRHLQALERMKARFKFWESEAMRQADELDKLDKRLMLIKKRWGI